MNNPKFGFWFNATFAVLNLYMVFFTPFNAASLLCLVVGLLNARVAYQLRDHA